MLSARLPARVRAGGRAMFACEVTVTNESGRRVQGLAASRPDITVLRGGAVMAPPLPRDEVGLALDLPPGASRTFAAEGSLRGLAPGRYEVRAELRVGEVVSAGGPWPLEVV